MILHQVKAILTSLAKNVHANEKGCVKYLVLEQTSADADRPDMVLIEEFVAISPSFPPLRAFFRSGGGEGSAANGFADGCPKRILTNTMSSII